MLPHRGVEQLVARRAHNPKVAGSSPAPATKKTLEEILKGFLLHLISWGYETGSSMLSLRSRIFQGILLHLLAAAEADR